jgi:FtsZ-interacting cell division protein YlmF
VYFTPQSYNEAPEIALSYKNNNAVMVDMRLLNSTDSQRIMDFLLGMKMVTDGSLKRVKKHLFVLTPKAVTNINFQNADEFAFTR